MRTQTIKLRDAVDAIFLGMPAQKGTNAPAAGLVDAKVINIRDIQDDALCNPEDLATIPIQSGESFRRFEVQPSDVLLTARSTLKVAIVGKGHTGALATANLIVVRPGPVLAAPLLFAFLRNPATRQKLEQLKTGTTVSSINVAVVSELLINIPTLDQQAKLTKLAQASEEASTALLQAATLRRKIAQEILAQELEPR